MINVYTYIYTVHVRVLFLILNLYFIGSADYDPGPYNILFSAGETIKPFNILIFDNDTFEALETFNLIISPSSFVSLGITHQAVVRITDDDDGK